MAPHKRDDSPAPSSRKRRRPPLSCIRCRRRKIRCDRQTPCQPCARDEPGPCVYVYDSRPEQTKAPFQGHQTKFSVFKHTPISNDPEPRATNVEEAKPTSPIMTERSMDTWGNNGTSSTGAVVETEDEPVGEGATWADSMTESYTTTDPLEGNSDAAFEQPFFPLCGSSPYRDLAAPELGQESESAGMSSFPDKSSDDSIEAVLNSPLSAYQLPLQDFIKHRVYGNSHWLNYFHQSPEILSVLQAHEIQAPGQGSATLSSCKAMAKAVREHEELSAQLPGTPRGLLPARDVADRLVEAFIRTYQTVFGILHVPVFLEDYRAFWEAIASATPEFTLTLFLVMSIGSVFCPHEPSIPRAVVLNWISVASTSLSSLESKPARNLDSLRVRCLLLLAQRVTSAKGDGHWCSAGSLVRMAMRQGLHRDPKICPASHMSASEAESRRKLWVAILELDLQSSMDCGGLPSIDSQDYDTALPSNADDASLALGGAVVDPKPVEQFTTSSFQILLMETLPVRIKIARLVNGSHCETSFAEALSLSGQLTRLLGLFSDRIKGYCVTSSSASADFGAKAFDLFVRRFLPALHHPFASMEKGCPFYFYSLNVCLESSIAILSTLSCLHDDDFHLAQTRGGGIFHRVYIQSALYICRELLRRVEIQSTPFADPEYSEMVSLVVQYLNSASTRMDSGDFKTKSYMLIAASLAHAEALRCGVLPEKFVSEAVKKSLDTCYARLAMRLPSTLDINYVSQQNFAAPGQQQACWSPWDQTVSMDSLEDAACAGSV